MSSGIEPTSESWLTAERENKLRHTFSNCTEMLVCSGQLSALLHYWLRNEIAIEASLNCEMWPSAEYEVEVNEEYQNFINSYPSSSLASLSDELIKEKLMVRAGGMRWARFHWGNQLEEMFLEKKSLLDKASCRIIRLKDKNLAQEIYYRILASEDSMANLALKFSDSRDKLKGGLIPLSPLSELPFGLEKILPKLNIGEVTSPQRLGDSFALVELIEMHPSVFDTETERNLLKLELNRWLGMMTIDLMELLL